MNSKSFMIIFITAVVSFTLCAFTFFKVNTFSPLSFNYVNLANESFSNNETYSLSGAFQLTDEQSNQSNNGLLCYTANIKLPDDITDIAFYIPMSYSSYIMYANDDAILLQSSNHPGSTIKPNIIQYHVDSSSIQLKIYFNENDNLHLPYTDPFNNGTFLIGSADAVSGYKFKHDMYDIILIIIALISTLYHSLLYIYNRQKLFHISFCLIGISLAASIMFTSQCLISYFIPTFPMIWSLRLLLLSFCTRILAIMLYISIALKNDILQLPYYLIHMLNSVACILICFLPVHYLLFMLPTLNLITIICILFALYSTGSSYRKKHDIKYAYLISGLLILLAGIVTNVLYANNNLNPGYHFAIYQLLFIFLESFLLALDQHYVNTVTGKIASKLKQSTYEIQNNHSTYISTHIKPDYLYETLESIKEYTGVNYDKVDSLVQALAKYLRQSLDFSATPQDYSLLKELDNCKAYAILVKEQYPDIQIDIDYPRNLPDTSIIQLSILSLIENAVTHAFSENPYPKITVSARVVEDRILISVSDNGVGMTHAEIRDALELPGDGLNIGLYYINHQLIDKWNEGISITSSHNRGTHISFYVGITPREEVFY